MKNFGALNRVDLNSVIIEDDTANRVNSIITNSAAVTTCPTVGRAVNFNSFENFGRRKK